MKIRLMLSFLIIVATSSFTPEKIVEEIPIVEIEEIVVSEPPEEVHQLNELIEAIGKLESNNRYDVVNRFGFMGKYQFSPRTVKYLGFDVTREQFLNNPQLQDSVMISYLRNNYSSLQHHIQGMLLFLD